MKLERLIDECAEALQEEACNDWGTRDSGFFGVCVDTKDGYLDIGYKKDEKGHWEAEVIVYHDNESQRNPRYSTNIEQYLSDMLYDCVDWDAVEDEWRENDMDEYQRNGFDSEADFWRWKEGK